MPPIVGRRCWLACGALCRARRRSIVIRQRLLNQAEKIKIYQPSNKPVLRG